MGKLREMWESNDGPIPGENYTSDTRNYPWHREPDIKDLDEAVDLFIEKVVKDPKRGPGVVAMLDLGVPISDIASIFVKQGLMNGKWTVDYAIMVAGPIARIIQMMANHAEIEYTTGWEDERETPTAAYFKPVDNPIEEEVSVAPEPELEQTGFLAPPETLEG